MGFLAKGIIVVDDDIIVRESVAALLEAHGFEVRLYESGQSLLREIDRLEPSCLLCDVRMPDGDGLDILKELRTRKPGLPVILMTGHGDVQMAVAAMKAGAYDFVEKPVVSEALLAVVGAAVESGSFAGGPACTSTAQFQNLTRRERDILAHLVIGHPNKVIAAKLGISPRTVEIHRARVMQKTQAESLSHLVRMAIAAGISA